MKYAFRPTQACFLITIAVLAMLVAVPVSAQVIKGSISGTAVVEVTGRAPIVETTEAQITDTFSATYLNNLPGIQENQGLDNLAVLLPGVSASRDLFFSNTNGGTGFSVNGLRGRENDQQIDGQNNNDNSVAGPAIFLSNPEFVDQYQITTN